MKCQLFIAVVCLISLSHSAHNNAVCIQGNEKPDPIAKDFPEVSEIFVTEIEMNVAVNQTTRTFVEIFDSPRNRAVIGERAAVGQFSNISLFGKDIYNFYSNQIVEVIALPDGSHYCNASQLDGRGADTFMFGDSVTSKTGFNAASAFLVSQAYPPVYKGKVTLDMGVNAERWLDCHYIPALDATVTAEWYFTDSDDWTPSLGKNHAVPVMLKIKGRLADIRDIEHTYVFNTFLDHIPDSAQRHFMIPQGTVCPHLKAFDAIAPTAHYIPPIASKGFFSMKAEYVQMTGDKSGLVTTIKESFDNSLMLSRFEYVPQGMLNNFFTEHANHPLTEIHDFLTGVAYVIDDEHGNCTIMPLAQHNMFDIVSTDETHVRMKTIREFFGLDGTAGSSMNWTYSGRRKVRDINADIYVAQKIGYPPGVPANLTSIWEIAFATEDYFDIVSGSTEVGLMEPIRLWIKLPDVDYTIAYNIFDFNEEEPDVWIYDVANCFTDDQKSNVHFRLEGDQAELMERNRKEFTYWLFTSIIGYAGLSPIRVSGLTWNKDDDRNTVRVAFQVLDTPTIKGSTNDKLPSSYLISTADAVAALNESIVLGDFVVEVGSIGDGTLQPVLAISESVFHRRYNINVDRNITVDRNVTFDHNNTLVKKVEVPKKVIKLNSGAAAGVAIGFLAAGVLVGVLVIFLINKFRSEGNLPNLALKFD